MDSKECCTSTAQDAAAATAAAHHGTAAGLTCKTDMRWLPFCHVDYDGADDGDLEGDVKKKKKKKKKRR